MIIIFVCSFRALVSIEVHKYKVNTVLVLNLFFGSCNKTAVTFFKFHKSFNLTPNPTNHIQTKEPNTTHPPVGMIDTSYLHGTSIRQRERQRQEAKRQVNTKYNHKHIYIINSAQIPFIKQLKHSKNDKFELPRPWWHRY